MGRVEHDVFDERGRTGAKRYAGRMECEVCDRLLVELSVGSEWERLHGDEHIRHHVTWQLIADNAVEVVVCCGPGGDIRNELLLSRLIAYTKPENADRLQGTHKSTRDIGSNNI